MSKAEARDHYYLKQNQRHILMLLFKFRFVTVPLLTSYKTLKSNSVRKNLEILRKEKYVDRKFDHSFKLDRKAAIYYLTSKGMAILKADPRISPETLHTFYKNKVVSDAFMQHTVDTFEIYNILNKSYGTSFDLFTKQEVAHLDDFPRTTPDLYLRGGREYFVTLAHDVPLFLIRKRLAEYIAHFDEEGWTSGDYPALLFIFASASHAQRFVEFAGTLLENAGIDDDELQVGVTTRQALHAEPASTAIWTFTGDARTPRQLTD